MAAPTFGLQSDSTIFLDLKKLLLLYDIRSITTKSERNTGTHCK